MPTITHKVMEREQGKTCVRGLFEFLILSIPFFYLDKIIDCWPSFGMLKKWNCTYSNRCVGITTNQNSSNKHSDYATLVTVSVTDLIARVDSDRSYNSVGLVTVTYLASPGYVVSI